LTGYARDARPAVQRELLDLWDHVEPSEYAIRVLADAPLVDGAATAYTVRTVLAADKLTRLRRLTAYLNVPVDLAELCDVPVLAALYLNGGATDGWQTLTQHGHLEALRIINEQTAVDPRHIPELPRLDWLFIRNHPSITDLLSFPPDRGGLRYAARLAAVVS